MDTLQVIDDGPSRYARRNWWEHAKRAFSHDRRSNQSERERGACQEWRTLRSSRRWIGN
jgi:hypothetical protein